MQHKRLIKCFIATFIIVLTIISLYQKHESYTINHRKPSSYITYTVKQGECIDEIAGKYKPKYVKLQNYRVEIQVLNNTNELIYPGTKLLIPIY